MDSSSLIALAVLIAAAALLVLATGAEAGVIPITRRRLRGATTAGLASLLRAYVRERQRTLRALRTGVTVCTVAAVAAAVVIASNGAWASWRALFAALLTLVVISNLRSAARILVLSRSDLWAPRMVAPVRVLQALLMPLAWLLSSPVSVPLRALGWRGSTEDVDPAEELVGMLEAADEEDLALHEERRMVRGVLEMADQTVRELMTPRTDITAVSLDASFGDVMKVVSDSGFSRIPLYDGSLDRIVGVIYAKDLLAYVMNGNVTPRLDDIARPPYLVPETKRANELLADLRRDKVHMAIAVDEYGGTAGLITVEDLVEEIVGAITDEYDTVDVDVQRVSESEAIVDASLTIDELNELFETEIRSDDFDTVGGLIVTELGRLAVPGDEIIAPRLDEAEETARGQLALRVLSILGRRIKKVRVTRYVPVDEVLSEAAEAV